MKNLKKAQMKKIVYLIPVLIIVVLIIMWATNSFDIFSSETGAFLSSGDYDDDEFNDKIDLCPCDNSDDYSSLAYKFKPESKLPKTGLFKDTPTKILADDLALIKNYLEGTSFDGNLYLSAELTANMNGGKTPSDSLFCQIKRTDKTKCLFSDFAIEFLELNKVGDSFAKTCATDKDVCMLIIEAKTAKETATTS